MTLSTTQFNKIYERFLLLFLKEGIVPTYQDVISRAGDAIPDATEPSKPLFKFVPQLPAVFDIDTYNTKTEDILLDLQILFDELTLVNRANITRILNADLFQNAHSHELKRLSNELDSLLFALDGASDNFFGKFDDFIDISKTDTDKSTPGVVDQVEEKIALPIGMQGVQKVLLDHLTGLTSPTDLTISREDVTNLGNVPGTLFGNSFADVTKVWGLLLESDTEGPLKISFSFRLKHEEFVNRLTFKHHGVKPQEVTVSTSVDKVNIKDIQEYSDGVELKDQGKVVSLDFDDRLVDYVHLTCKKEASDSFVDSEDGTKKYRYVFGFKNISAYVTGRVSSASYVSKPFDFSEDLAAIGKIGLTANEFFPDNTNIQWSVAGVTDQDEQVGPFIPIVPQNRLEKAGVSTTVSLQDTLTNTKNLITNLGDEINIETFQSIKYYQIGTVPTEPVFGTASLFKGINVWRRDKSEAVNPILVKDNFVSFSKGDTQKLYVARQDVLAPKVISLNDQNINVVITSKPPLYNPSKGHFLVPDPDISPDKDTAPIYAVYSAFLSLVEDIEQQTNVTFELGTDGLDKNGLLISKTIDLASSIIKYKTSGDILIEKMPDTGEKTYIDGTDYIVKLDEDGFPTGEIIGISEDFLSATYEESPGVFVWQSLKITFTLDDNILRHVIDITGNQVFFNLVAGSIPDDASIVIKYRYPADNILKASVKAKNNFGLPGESKIFIQGQDYILDPANGTIQRLSTGAIEAGQDIYVDFKFNDISSILEQFFVWVNILQPGGITLSLERDPTTEFSQESLLKPDSDNGEELLASVPGLGLINLTEAADWPKMSGWVQFVVKSKDPEKFNNALINQVIKVRDIDGDFVFKKDGKYFDELTADREPMVQVSYPYLRTNVLKNDDSFFAVRDIIISSEHQYQIIVNFQPNVSQNFYRYTAESNQNNTNEIGLQSVPEEWKIRWVSSESNADSFTKVIVKADLSRTAGINGNITPKVDKYFLKVGY